MWLGCGGHDVNPSSPIALTSIQRQWPFMSHHFFAMPHCYPLHKEAALFVHCCKCQTCLSKFICISRCTQHALALTPYGKDVYRGPPADLGNKVFQKSKYLAWGSFKVVLNKKYVMSCMVLGLAFVWSWCQILVHIMSSIVIFWWQTEHLLLRWLNPKNCKHLSYFF